MSFALCVAPLIVQALAGSAFILRGLSSQDIYGEGSGRVQVDALLTGLGADQPRLEAADALGALADESGITLIQMAIAFVIRHPAVTSAIIGPRSMEHLEDYLAADGINLSDDVLDQIDHVVPPGVTINVADNMWSIDTPALTSAFRRR